MTNNFCKYLSNQIRVEYGQQRPCCWFTESVNVTNITSTQQFQQDLNKIVDWETANGRCNECKHREEKGLHSPRLQSLSRGSFDGVTDDSKVSIEIQIDKDCNGACLICGPWNSTTWEKYDYKIRNIPIKDVADPTIASLEFIEQLSKSIDFSAAREILILGGEPLRTDSHVRLLQNVLHPEHTALRYTTNGSYCPDEKTIDLWRRFKKVELQFSVDGVGDHFNYLRWPLQWHQVENNLQFLLDLPPGNIKLTQFSYTTTPFSLFYHDRYVEWASKFFKNTTLESENMFQRPWQPRGDTPMKLSAIPPKLQLCIKGKYGPEHAITRLLEPFDIKQYRSFTGYIQHHDKHRQLNWREIFPEISEFY